MKLFCPLVLLLIVTFSSCTSEEQTNGENYESLLKSYKISRDSQGLYSIDYELKDNTSVDVVKDIDSNSSEIHLFSGNVTVDNSQSQSLSLEKNQLQIGFYENGEVAKSLVLEDDPIALAKGEESQEFLQTYSMTDLGDGNFQLDFKVKEGIIVWFDYNEEESTYKVHLKEGVSNGLEFSKNYVKTSDVLKINFVNYYRLNSGKGTSVEYETKEKPRSYWNS